MRTTPALAGLLAMLALPCVAMADDIPFDLLAGHDYNFSATSNEGATVTLTAPGGAPIGSIQANNDDQIGVEFRAQYSATYTAHTDPAGVDVSVFVDPDCRGSVQTLCHLSVNHTHQGKFDASYDADWFATTLLAGRTYRISYDGGLGADVGVRDAQGRDLVPEPDFSRSGTLTFRPRVKGRYYISVQFDDFEGCCSAFYTVGLR